MEYGMNRMNIELESFQCTNTTTPTVDKRLNWRNTHAIPDSHWICSAVCLPTFTLKYGIDTHSWTECVWIVVAVFVPRVSLCISQAVSMCKRVSLRFFLTFIPLWLCTLCDIENIIDCGCSMCIGWAIAILGDVNYNFWTPFLSWILQTHTNKYSLDFSLSFALHCSVWLTFDSLFLDLCYIAPEAYNALCTQAHKYTHTTRYIEIWNAQQWRKHHI